jgi:hypothetical protein
MKFGSPEYYQYLKEVQLRLPASGVHYKRHSMVEITGVFGIIRLSFASKLPPRLRRVIVRDFFRHNKQWFRYFKTFEFEHEGEVRYDPHRTKKRGFPLFQFKRRKSRPGFEIQLKRLSLGWSQKKLSRLSGIPQGHISKIERGLVKMRRGTRMRLLQAMSEQSPDGDKDSLLMK